MMKPLFLWPMKYWLNNDDNNNSDNDNGNANIMAIVVMT